ncbi:MBL fold metallo-hydrolase [Scatolibacter rhodanostii]|uniref:MBL fold metallo-hydrolase n=1 Tax=Scatolibacter rhodanostii TaxID=2014781 RepID=UPI000C083E9F|nr:MBL fold metallo-hydrolase [Scatolibacter rhodanostii]
MSNWKKHMQISDEFASSIKTQAHKVYDINPYVLVFENEENSHIHHLYFDAHSKGAAVWMHLIEGKDRALLIDTGFGIGNLKGLVETLTDKPFDVVNTHFHGDHSAGNSQFERIFCHKYDVPYLQDTFKHADHRMLPPAEFFKPEDVVPIEPYEIVSIEDGHQFVLGENHAVEVIHMPGHAAGGCILLDHQSGMLFSGDAILSTPTLIIGRFPNPYYPECLTVTAFRDTLSTVMPRLQSVKKLYPSHSRLGLSPIYLQDMLDCCNAIISHPDEYEVYDYVPDPDQKQIKCIGNAMIVYSNSRI